MQRQELARNDMTLIGTEHEAHDNYRYEYMNVLWRGRNPGATRKEEITSHKATLF